MILLLLKEKFFESTHILFRVRVWASRCGTQSSISLVIRNKWSKTS